jgi:hypothetical protein
MPVAPEHAGGGPVYFAWVDADETTFGPEHVRYDDYIFTLNLHLEEGQLPTATLTMKNPGALLATGRKRWVWIAFLIDGEVVPKFFGSVVAIPSGINQRKVEVHFIAKPLDYLARKQAAANALKAPPYYHRAFIKDELADDPDTILEALPADWHHNPVTGEVTVSDKLVGEDGVIEFTSGKVIYGSLDWSIGDPPRRAVNMVATVTWKQTATGVMAMPATAVSGPIANAVLNAWPKPGTQIGDAYTVETSFATDTAGVDNQQTTSYSWSYQNKEKTHINGDIMSANWSLTTIMGPFGPLIGFGVGVTQLYNFQQSVQRTFGDPETGQALSLQEQWSGTYVANYSGHCAMSLRYDASRDRTEHLKFTLSAVMQPIVNDDGATDDVETLELSGGDVGRLIDGEMPIGDPSRRDYFSGDTDAVKYVINVARAHLISNARPVAIRFGTLFAAAAAASCRNNGRVHDPSLPGGVALGKVVTVDLDADGGSLLFSGKIGLACAVGTGAAVEAVTGTPSYVDASVLGPDVQVYDGQVIALPSGDLGYTPPVDDVNDDGLVFPLTLDQVLVRNEVISSGNPLAGLSHNFGGVPLGIDDLVQSGKDTATAIASAAQQAELRVEIELKPLNRAFEAEHVIAVTDLYLPQQVNLGAS